MDTQVRPANQDPLVNWYTGNDGPWIPKGISEVVPDERHSRTRVGSRMPMQYGTYRQTIPSDAGSYAYGAPPSDSGYGSNGARRSDGNGSVFSADVTDRDQDLQSLASHVADFQQYQGLGEVMQSRDVRQNEWTAPLRSSSTLDSTPSHVCPTCHKSVKTRSELKKHDLRHTKPFTCEFPGCSRTEGFSTTNDLERHVKSKHPSAVQGTESTKRFRCLVQGCKSKDKSWPRLDNFRSHLKRIHHLKPEDEDEMARRAEFWEATVNANQDRISPLLQKYERYSLPDSSQTMEPVVHPALPRVQDVESNWKQVYPDKMEPSKDHLAPKMPLLDDDNKAAALQQKDSLNAGFQETVQPLEIFSGLPPTHESPPSLSKILAPVSRSDSAIKESPTSPGPAAQPVKAPQGKATRHDVSASETAQLTEAIKTALVRAPIVGDDDDSLHQTSLPAGQTVSGPNRVLSSPAPASRDINLVESHPTQESSRELDAQKKAIAVLKTLHDLGYIIHKDPSHSPKPQNPGSAASSKSDHLVVCQKCGKFRGRPCELKKHMKRHSRPYGCTFLNCNKAFGSKNDWKRHENSQHFHLETWRCDEEKPEGGACAKVCYRKNTFEDHLKKDHSISDVEALKSKVDGCRIGRNCQARFWCGFCTKLIDLTKKGIEAWTERFDHIDDHFMGRKGLTKQSIQDWVPIDSDKPKGEPHSLDPSPGKESNEESSSPSGSSNGSPSDHPDSARASPAHASTPEPHVGPSNKRKHSGSSDDPSPQKKTRAPYKGPMLIYCCHCHAGNNSKFNQNCTNCDDAHIFCSNCTAEKMPTGQDVEQ